MKAVSNWKPLRMEFLTVVVLLLLSALCYIFYKWSTKDYDVFQKRGIPFQKPLPLIGCSLPFITNQLSLHKRMIELYRATKQHKIYGFFNFRTPFFIVNDPELMKKIGVKDFDAFTNHQRFFDFDELPLISAVLSVMRDQRWKNMRYTLTPIFTGAKMRAMFTLMNECFTESMKYLHDQTRDSDSFDIELKDCFSRLSNDLIATTAFGLKVNSFKNKENEFFIIGQSFTKGKGKQALKFVLYSMAPKLFKLLGLTLFDDQKIKYFLRLVVEAMQYRSEHNIVRPDMIQLLMEARKESLYHWTEEEIVAQCFIFFFAAFENNANLLCTTCHELMENPHVQDKLYQEVMDTHRELDSKILDYDTLQRMKYMDMVVAESLRKWSLNAMIDRECGKDYTVTDEDGNFVCELKKGDRVWLQTIGIHWDPEYYERPEVFEPERFSEKKAEIKPLTYTPFGVGPRICIGNRYALMQAKAMLYYLLKDFKLERSVRSTTNLMNDLRGFTLEPKTGFWLKLSKRNN